jgi:hypothetical protein
MVVRSMETAVRSMETTETTMETDGDGSGGTSPSQQGAETETSVPQNLSLTVAALRNCSGKNADCFRVFRREALYRRRGIVRSGPGWSHHRWARWYVSNVSIIFDAPCLFLHHLLSVSLHFMAFLCIFWN